MRKIAQIPDATVGVRFCACPVVQTTKMRPRYCVEGSYLSRFTLVRSMPSMRMRRVSASRRGEWHPLAIEVRHAGNDFVCSHLCNLARVSINRLFDKLPIRHLGFTGGLAVDGPARPVIVRSANFGALIDVAEYAEMKVGIRQ